MTSCPQPSWHFLFVFYTFICFTFVSNIPGQEEILNEQNMYKRSSAYVTKLKYDTADQLSIRLKGVPFQESKGTIITE